MLDIIKNLISNLKKQQTEPSVESPVVPVSTPSSDQSIAAEVLFRLSYDAKSNFQSAIKKFQTDQGLSADGKLGPVTMAKVRLYEEKLKLAPAKMGRMRRFRATHYHIAEESDYTSPKIPVYDKDKNIICHAAASFFCNAALEGTGKIKDGRLINVAGKNYVDVDSDIYSPAADVFKKHIAYMKSKNRTPRPSRYFGVDYVDGKVLRAQPFQVVKEFGKGFGIGKKGIPYETNKTLATDQGLYGTSEPKFKGKGGLWPAGTRGWLIDAADESEHDGWFTSADVGGGIFGAHIDVFVGTKEHVTDLPIRSNAVTYVWFDGIEERIAADYDYGLFDRR